MLQVWPLTSGPQSSPLLALAAAWTLPLVLAALWALCLVPLTGMLHPRPLVQVGPACGLFVDCTCTVDSWHHLLRSGGCCTAPRCGYGKVSPAPLGAHGSLLRPVSILLVQGNWLGWSLQLSSPRARSALQHSFHQMSATCCILT